MTVGNFVRFNPNVEIQLYSQKQTSSCSSSSLISRATRHIEPHYLMNKNIVLLDGEKTNLDNSLSSTEEEVHGNQILDQDGISIINEEIDEETPEEYTQRLDGIKETIREIVIEKGIFFPLNAEALLLVGKNQVLYTDDQLFKELKVTYKEIISKHKELTDQEKKYFEKKVNKLNKFIKEEYDSAIEEPNDFIDSLSEIVHMEQGSLIQKMEWLESIYSVLFIRTQEEKKGSFYEQNVNHLQKCIKNMNSQDQDSLVEKLRQSFKTYKRASMKEEQNQYRNQSNV
jgi:hypothetical protein